jgi:DNA-directed RNA polymerase subunit RPC12/RpoP
MQAYCMKCRKKVEMKDSKSIKMKNGKPATKGVCPKCGTKVFRIGKG